jgi:hypothetical protein
VAAAEVVEEGALEREDGVVIVEESESLVFEGEPEGEEEVVLVVAVVEPEEVQK